MKNPEAGLLNHLVERDNGKDKEILTMEHEKVFEQMTEDLKEWGDKGYPIPDPAWDYNELWSVIHEYLKPELETLIQELAKMDKMEEATSETDKKILVRLQWLQTYIDRCKSYLNVESR